MKFYAIKLSISKFFNANSDKSSSSFNLIKSRL